MDRAVTFEGGNYRVGLRWGRLTRHAGSYAVVEQEGEWCATADLPREVASVDELSDYELIRVVRDARAQIAQRNR